MSEEVIRETISITRTALTDADRAIANEYNDLVREGLRQAKRILRFGSSAQKIGIIRACVQSAGRLASADSSSETIEQRRQFAVLLESMKVPASHDSPIAAISGPVDDQDDLERLQEA